MSRVTVLFFGAAADRAGTRETVVAVEDALTLDELWELLIDRYPDLRPMRKTIAFAVNQQYAILADSVAPGDEVPLLPPVSGG